MRRAERRDGHQRAACGEDPGNRVDSRHLERFGASERRKDPREPPSQHRLAGPRRPHQKHVVRASRRDLEHPPRSFLPANVRQVRRRRLRRACRERLVRRCVDLAAEICDDLRQVTHGNRLDPGESSLRRRFDRADYSSQPGAASSLGDGQRSCDRTNTAVERELPDGGMIREALGRELSRRAEDGERDRQVEPGALLPERRRREIDGDAPIEWPLERGGHDAAPDPVLRLLAGAVGKSYDREARDAGLQVRFDLDLARLEPDEGMGERASEHHPTVTTRRSRVVTASVTSASNRPYQAV